MNRRSLSRIVSLTVGTAAVGLVGFHVALFWQRIADATISHPAVLMRWVASALLIGAALAARRYAAHYWSSRKTGFIFWMLVLLLHATVPADERLLTTHDVVSLVAEAGIAVVAAFFAVVAAWGSLLTLRPIPVSSSLAGHTLQQLLASPASPRAPPAL
jgi:hypothetical protein